MFVTLVRQTETPWLALGAQVLPLARAAHHRIAYQFLWLTQGKALTRGKMFNAYDLTMDWGFSTKRSTLGRAFSRTNPPPG